MCLNHENILRILDIDSLNNLNLNTNSIPELGSENNTVSTLTTLKENINKNAGMDLSDTFLPDYSQIGLSESVSLPSVCSASGEIFTPFDYETPTQSLNELSVHNDCVVVGEFNNNVPDESNPYSILNDIRVKNMNRVIFAHININSIRNKFNMLADLIAGKIDLLLISETKIDDTFPSSQFLIPGFSTPYRLDRTENSGGLILYVREDIPSKRIHCNINFDRFE